jgi:RHH-type proline utilization regulon transcriptional repressor/proline dehydrogenase/delta 1-pyrroline-5-carboxylate dehydrogenase
LSPEVLPAEAPEPDEAAVAEVARRLAAMSEGSKPGIYHLSWWSDRVMRWAMSHERFKTQLFRLVDVFPAIAHDDDRVASYLEQYFEGVEIPKLVEIGLSISDAVPGGHALSALVTRRNVEAMAHQFIAGSDPDSAARRVGELWRQGLLATVDLLGEHTVSSQEADGYAKNALELMTALEEASCQWPWDGALTEGGAGDGARFAVEPVATSVKVSALTAHFYPLGIERAVDEAVARLVPLAKRTVGGRSCLVLDVESFETKEIIHAVMERLCAHPELDQAHLGVVVQAYLLEADKDLEWACQLSAGRQVPLTVRLVKGAYWDTETVIAQANGWPPVVHPEKEATDASFERCARRLIAQVPKVRCAFGTHNLRSLSYVIATAQRNGIPPSGYELQLLYGMAEPMVQALRRAGQRVRLYCPVGELVPGMSYLVRRLLENTSNESFVRQRYAEGRSLKTILAKPHPLPPPEPHPLPPPGGLTEPNRVSKPRPGPFSPYRPEPPARWRSSSVRSAMGFAVAEVVSRLPRQVPVLVKGRPVACDRSFVSVDPGLPSRVVAEARFASPAEVAMAVDAAVEAQRSWGNWSFEARAGVLLRAAAWMRARRFELAAWQVFEVGKPWGESDADVCEAIDYCEYYAREALRLAAGGPVQSPPGESNALVYEPRGVVAVVSPWNFALAIPTGMVTAALVTGNTVLLKPAEQAPACALLLVEALLAAGLPPDAIGFLPGDGDVTGRALVEDPRVDMIAFTGSRQVGLAINEAAARRNSTRRSVARVVAEMGGKNAIIVDDDADLDEAVLGTVRSAFGYSGQKCSAASRVIVHHRIYDRFIERLAGATSSLVVGHAQEMGTQVGPLIEEAAVQRVEGYLSSCSSKLLVRVPAPENGFFAGPALVEGDDPSAPIATEEIFGPVLVAFAASGLDEAIELANRTDYGLTAGIFSRSPANVAEAVSRLDAGNVYVNRAITGAVVGRQPFGGRKLSGVGSKAGGPDYLVQFTNPKSVSENTMRHGFAPLEEKAIHHGFAPLEENTMRHGFDSQKSHGQARS